ncbi:uncharacterized protein LOC109402443 [Aedes albopictus]|uniref:DUF4789 domain-containing protein n=1 Tax=Aedes albopictus TaxID=7160 RepID=A0ABM1Z2U0_AEDAL|nr:uncharacterized protein LOC109402443 [Aedes albopictus]KXJ81421.1 hypothetical protein RP20_CCG019952 [Aedes albopictus]
MIITTLRFGAIATLSLLLILSLTSPINADVYFGYNEEPENNPDRQNARNRTAVYIPGKCGMNEILYPGDQESDWVCDCRPAHVYHPGSGGCHPLYTRAYCAEDEYVEIKPGAKLPQCTKNICENGLVPFNNGTCVKLHSNNKGVCPQIDHVKFLVVVNETTLQLDCAAEGPVKLNWKVGNRYNQEHPNVKVMQDGRVEFLTATKCAPGSAAEFNGTCADGVQPSTMEPVPVEASTANPAEDVQPDAEGSVI